MTTISSPTRALGALSVAALAAALVVAPVAHAAPPVIKVPLG
jgi:hypothetical protein